MQDYVLIQFLQNMKISYVIGLVFAK